MEFLGREKELALLEKDGSRQSSLALITGRRRVGKTRLIREFFKGKPALYFLATAHADRQILNDFARTVSECTGMPPGEYGSWTDAMRFLVTIPDGPRYLAIDEFQNVLREDDVKAEFQYIWDEVLSPAGFHLILCGSRIPVLESLYGDYGSPLYGRFTMHMALQALDFETVRGTDYCESVEEYAVLGGIPRYMEEFDDVPLEDNLVEHVFNPVSMMFDDPEILLRGEVKSLSSYMDIMRAVANGNQKLNDIAGFIQVPATTLAPYMKKLIDIRMLKRIVPVTEKDPSRSKIALYRISDNYTAFWFRFVDPYMSFLEMENQVPALNVFRRNFVDSHVSFVFEDICRRQVSSFSDELGFIPEVVGNWWTGDCEVDIVAINRTERKVFLGECRYWDNRAVPHSVLTQLMSKLPRIRGLEGYRAVYGLFSVTGFDASLYDERDVLLVDKGEIVKRLG